VTTEELAAFDAEHRDYIADVVIGPEPPPLDPRYADVIHRLLGGPARPLAAIAAPSPAENTEDAAA